VKRIVPGAALAGFDTAANISAAGNQLDGLKEK